MQDQIASCLQRIEQAKDDLRNDESAFNSKVAAGKERHHKAVKKAEIKIRGMRKRDRCQEEQFHSVMTGVELENIKREKRDLEKCCETLQAEVGKSKEQRRLVEKKQSEVLTLLRNIVGESQSTSWKKAIPDARAYVDRLYAEKSKLVAEFLRKSKAVEEKNDEVYDQEMALLDLSDSGVSQQAGTDELCSFDVTPPCNTSLTTSQKPEENFADYHDSSSMSTYEEPAQITRQQMIASYTAPPPQRVLPEVRNAMHVAQPAVPRLNMQQLQRQHVQPIMMKEWRTPLVCEDRTRPGPTVVLRTPMDGPIVRGETETEMTDDFQVCATTSDVSPRNKTIPFFPLRQGQTRMPLWVDEGRSKPMIVKWNRPAVPRFADEDCRIKSSPTTTPMMPFTEQKFIEAMQQQLLRENNKRKPGYC
ncbi:MAG: hypothetical protein KVP17_003744 [Porospora cf. gigantea B]|uniref:uncharacterized protein n=1 Tax=Porospora cf. gigantea B TaxID=2853592 RepID=UPI0035718273|nr:MAG: hypothetical protein KVP17_003744 [Porospora cf. gigantea B]